MTCALVVIFFAVMGAVLGSFACCQAWRLRYKETGKKDLGKRSVCLHCGKKLTWKENIPIVSWVLQKGKCRKCGKKIGKAELLAELGGAAAFGIVGWKVCGGYAELIGNCGFGLTWLCQQDVPMVLIWANAALVAIFLTISIVLAVYDAKWRELPLGLLIALNAVGVVYATVNLVFGEMEIVKLLEGIGILAGVYYLLYFLSKEKLVGGGDWILCLAIAMVLGDPWLAIWVLFLSNFIGAIVMLPQKKKKIAFGPFLVVAFVIVFAFSDVILSYV